jgi:hypothetical protein
LQDQHGNRLSRWRPPVQASFAGPVASCALQTIRETGALEQGFAFTQDLTDCRVDRPEPDRNTVQGEWISRELGRGLAWVSPEGAAAEMA